MKRIVCFAMSLILLVLFVMPVTAELDTASVAEDVLNAVAYSCTYEQKNNNVLIEGTVSYDYMVSHKDYKIRVISILPGGSYQSVISDPDVEILAETSISAKFTFYIKADSTLERYSKYAVIFTSPEGMNYLAAEPILPSVSCEFEYEKGDKSGFKGLHIDSPTEIGDSAAGTVIVDVDFGKTGGNPSDSILYPMNDTYIHISRSYIAAIDEKVQAASLSGARVYLRLLLSASNSEYSAAYLEEEGKYSIPDLNSEEVLDYIFTITSFLAQRYDEPRARIHGMILGEQIDDVENVNYIGDMSAEQYAELYALYLVVVGNAVWETDPLFNVVIPLSDDDDYSSDYYSDREVRASELLENVAHIIDNNVSGEFSCSVMIESNDTPFGITNGNINDGVKVDNSNSSYKLTPSSIIVFQSYLERLSEKYESAPQDVIYMWSVSPELRGNALCCAYAYTYLTLVSNDGVSSFVASFEGDAIKNYRSVKKVLQHIDSQQADTVLEPLAKYFGSESWYDILNGEYSAPQLQTFITKSFLLELPINVRGEFEYLDFTSSSVFDCMKAGQNCSFLHSEYTAEGVRALQMGTIAMEHGEVAESVCVFEYPEDYIYTPYISIIAGVSDEKADDHSLYEITLTMGMENARIVTTGMLKNGELAELFFDISEFSEISMCNYLKISVRCLTGKTEEMSVWLHSIKGYSAEYTSSELSNLIEQRRQQIRNEDSAEEGFDRGIIITIIGVTFAVGAVAIGLTIVFKRDEEDEDEDSDADEEAEELDE